MDPNANNGKTGGGAEKKPVKVGIKLLKSHEHGGVTHPAGARLDVREDQAERLVGNKTAVKA